MKALRKSLIFGLALAGVFLAIFVVVEAVGYLTWHLSGSSEISEAEFEKMLAQPF